MVVLGGVAVSYERGTPVLARARPGLGLHTEKARHTFLPISDGLLTGFLPGNTSDHLPRKQSSKWPEAGSSHTRPSHSHTLRRLTGFLPEDKGPYALTPNTVELIPTLGALFLRGGPVQDPVLTPPAAQTAPSTTPSWPRTRSPAGLRHPEAGSSGPSWPRVIHPTPPVGIWALRAHTEARS